MSGFRMSTLAKNEPQVVYYQRDFGAIFVHKHPLALGPTTVALIRFISRSDIKICKLLSLKLKIKQIGVPYIPAYSATPCIIRVKI